jgi:hypothetical protein
VGAGAAKREATRVGVITVPENESHVDQDMPGFYWNISHRK